MSPARWNLVGIIGVLLFASLWLAWGLSSGGQRTLEARRDLVGAWTVTELSGELPAQVMLEDGHVTRVEFEDSIGDLRVLVFARTADIDEYQVGTWSLSPVSGDAQAWDAGRFRVELRSAEEIELTETPVDGVVSVPPWRAVGTRREP